MRSHHLEKILGRLDELDATNLSNLVQRLARERELLETVFNVINEGILVISHKGIIEYSNNRAKEYIGLKDKDIGSTTLWKLIPEMTQVFSLPADFSTKTLLFRELTIAYPQARDLQFYLIPFDSKSSQDEEVSKFAVVLSDVTQEKQDLEEKLQSGRLSSIFMLAAGVAHEIGNPLNSINIHLELINRQIKSLNNNSPESKKIAQSVQVCIDEVDRLNSIITHFLNAIKPQKPELNEVSLFNILDSVLALQAQELQNAGIVVDVTINNTLPSILADKNQIKQAFFNVIKNSLEAMTSGGTLTITANSDSNNAYIHFQDTGSGIHEEDLGHIFEPYYSTKESGHGLGMMIIHRIMKDHGGNVSINSIKGQGTTLTLQFQLQSNDKKPKMLEN